MQNNIRINRILTFAILSSMVILMVTGLSSQVTAQERISLSSAIKIGLENNFQIRISRKDIEIAENNNSWGLAGRFPTVTLGISQANLFNDMDSLTVPGERTEFLTNSIKPNVNLNWILFNGFSIGITKEKFELLEKISNGTSAVVVENTVQAILLSYYRVLLEQEKLQILDEVLTLSSDRYDYELARKEIGSAVTFDVLQAKIAYLNDKANRLGQEMNLKSAQRTLNLVLGQPADREYLLTDTFKPQTVKFDLTVLKQKILSENKTLKNQLINQELLRNDISLSRSGRYPTLSLNMGAEYTLSRTTYEGLDPADTDSYNFYANFSISYSLYAGGNIERSIVNSKIKEAIGSLAIEEMKLSLINQLKTTYEFYNLRKELLIVAEESVESARLNLQISGEKFRAGAINSFNYRDVQLIYLNSAFARLQAIYNLIDSHTELMRLTGGIITEY